MRVCVCSSFLAGSGRPASRGRFGAPHLFRWPLCLSALLGPLPVGVAPLLVLCWSSPCFPSPPPPPAFFVVSPPRAPLCLLLSLVSDPGCLGPWRFVFLSPPPGLWFFFAPPRSLAFPRFRPRVPWALALCAVCFVNLPPPGSPCSLASSLFPARPLVAPWWLLPPPPPPFLSRRFRRCLSVLGFFFVVRPRCLWLSLVPGLGCPGPWCCWFFLCGPSASLLSVRSCPFCVFHLAVGCSLVVAAPPCPLFGALFSSLGAPFFVFFFRSFVPSLSLPPLSLAFSGFRPRVPLALVLCVFCFAGLPLLGSLCALASFVFPAWPLAAPW